MFVPGTESGTEAENKMGRVFTWATRNPALWKDQAPFEMKSNGTQYNGGQVASPCCPSAQGIWELWIAFPNIVAHLKVTVF